MLKGGITASVILQYPTVTHIKIVTNSFNDVDSLQSKSNNKKITKKITFNKNAFLIFTMNFVLIISV